MRSCDGAIVKRSNSTNALTHDRTSAPLIEAEAKTLNEVREAVAEGVDILLLDNMTLPQIRQAVKIAKGKCLLEISGGVNLKNVRGYAATGVERISIGALTHSAPSVDISFEIETR